jgi:integrase
VRQTVGLDLSSGSQKGCLNLDSPVAAAMPADDSVLDFRDRAILKTFLYSGVRLGTACRLKVSDFHHDAEEATLRPHEKGDKRRTIGLHFLAAQAIQEHIEKLDWPAAPLFPPLLNPRSRKLAERPMSPVVTMYRLVQTYLEALPAARKAAPPGTARAEYRVYPSPLPARHHRPLLLDARRRCP